jgi:hypothetical protein
MASTSGSRVALTEQAPTGDIWMMRWNGKHQRPVSPDKRFEFREDVGVAPLGTIAQNWCR